VQQDVQDEVHPTTVKKAIEMLSFLESDILNSYFKGQHHAFTVAEEIISDILKSYFKGQHHAFTVAEEL
jgi:metal-dependent HD superfamily phosphatase/phosphodiesterase